MYLHAGESVSFLQGFHLELNTLALNSSLLSDTLILFLSAYPRTYIVYIN